jgi:hypothetical protein
MLPVVVIGSVVSILFGYICRRLFAEYCPKLIQRLLISVAYLNPIYPHSFGLCALPNNTFAQFPSVIDGARCCVILLYGSLPLL